MFLKKKSIASILLCVFIPGVVTLSACSGKKGEAESSGSKKVTVTHYSINTDDKLYIKELMPDFEKKHPNIKMDFLTVPYENFDSKLQTLVASNTPPDVTSHYGDGGFIEYFNKDILMDLTPLVEKAKFKAAEVGIPDELMNIYKINGKTYGIPVSAYVTLLAYNKELFDKAKVPYPPSSYDDKSWTFDKAIETAKKLTIQSKNPAEMQFGMDFFWAERDMRPLYFGQKVYSDDTWTNGGHPSACYFDSPEVIKAIQKHNDLMHVHKVMPTPTDVKGLTGGDSTTGDPFLSGKVAMSVGGSWIIANVTDIPFKVGVAAVPAGNNDKVRSVLYVDPLLILKGSKNPDQAFEWIQFLVSKEAQEKAVEISGNPPANKKASDKYYNSFPGVDPKDVKNVVEGAIKYGVESYNHLISNYSQINEIVKNEQMPMENDNVPAEQVAKNIQKKVSEIIKKK